MVSNPILACRRPKIDDVGIEPECQYPSLWELVRHQCLWSQGVVTGPGVLAVPRQAVYEYDAKYRIVRDALDMVKHV